MIIFPEARERRSGPHNRCVTTVRPGADGRFEAHALPPATYFAIAVSHLQDGEWAEREQLERLASRAARFTLADGESKTIAVRLRVR